MSICLNMIVKDEAHVVAETLACVAPYIDTWVVVDTGSTDETIDIVRSFFAAREIPGEVHERPWINFGENRTQALELCKDKADYIWVIDADDLVVGTLDLSNLTLDSYLLRFGSEVRYWRKQIFRSGLRWKYEGAIHEYPTCLDANSTEARLEGAYHIESRRLRSRNQSSDKCQRDIRILLQSLQTDPSDSRSTFYLAQSYMDAGDNQSALEYYARRAEMGGWNEEIFCAMLRSGECLERLGEPWERALETYLRSWQVRPQRAEPLYRIARYYRSEGNYNLGELFARRAKDIPFPKGDALFVAADVYDWKIDDELSICTFYASKYRESFDLCTHLLDVPTVPAADRERILANRDFAAEFVRDEPLSYREDIVSLLAQVSNPAKPSPQITLTITSCRRLDLFEKTVNSFLNCCADLELIDRWICIDDGSSASDRARMKERYPFFEFVFKDPGDKGHARSMNILLDRIESPFWLHLEDDWQFIVKDLYLEKALAVLDHDSEIGQVLFNRNYGETLECRDILGGFVRRTERQGVRYRLHEHLQPGTTEYDDHIRGLPPGGRSNVWWPHYSLRPSLIRMSAIRETGGYNAESGHFELDFARRYTQHGFRSAFFDAINSLHIGRLTWETRDKRPNAYDLNNERQFESPDRSTPYRVKLLTNWTSSRQLCELWDRQSKGERRWGNIEITGDDEEIDYWAIINHPSNSRESFEKDRTIIFHMEPSRGVATWGDWASPDPREFLQVRSHGRYRNNSEWHLDLHYSELLTRRIEKTRELSCVTSGKTQDPGQRLRIQFLKYLEEAGTALEIFGSDNIHSFREYRGTLPPHNKNDGILPYRHTIAVENCAEVNYFTEKIVDAILGECLCFYWGCPNLEDYIDPAAFIRLPLDDFEESRRILEGAIRDNERERRLDAIRREKHRILDEYQFLPTLARIIDGHRFAQRLSVKVLNLDRRQDRWDSFREAARQAAGNEFLARCARFAAVDGLSLVMNPVIQGTFRGNDFRFRRGIVACALSHMAIWRETAEGNRASLVFEDDTRLCEGFFGQLVEACGALTGEHEDFDLAFLGYLHWAEHEPSSTYHLSTRLFPMEWEEYLGGCFAYIVSPKGARQLLALVERDGIPNAIDWFIMRHTAELKALQCVPHVANAPLAIPGSSTDSDIQHDFVSVAANEAERIKALASTHPHDSYSNFLSDLRAFEPYDQNFQPGAGYRIPRVIHFIYLGGGYPFSITHYLAVRTAHEIQHPKQILIFNDREPVGNIWWERAKEYATVVNVRVPTVLNGHEIPYLQHRADVMRINILRLLGGIYFDIDVLSLKSVEELLVHRVVMAREAEKGLANSVILAERDSPFLKAWIREYETSYGGVDDWWAGLSIRTPLKLAANYPEDIHVLEQAAFLPFLYNDDRIYTEDDSRESLRDSYTIHLWETEASKRDIVPRDLDYFSTHDNTFTKLFRRYVELYHPSERTTRGDAGRLAQLNQEIPLPVRDFLSAQLKGKPAIWPPDTTQTDIESFIQYTDDRRIQPLLYYLHSASDEMTQWPAQIREAFRQRSLMETIAGRLRTDEASKLLDALAKAGLRVLAVKGAALGHMVYPHPGMRPARDVDLLIEESMSAPAEEILQSFGYTCTMRYARGVAYRRVDTWDFSHYIDLHFTLRDARIISREFSLEELFERSIPLSALGASARTLCQADTLLLACTHLTQHRDWNRSIWLYDIHLLAGRLGDEEAAIFVRLASNIRAACHRGLELSRQVFDTRYSSEVMTEFSDQAIKD